MKNAVRVGLQLSGIKSTTLKCQAVLRLHRKGGQRFRNDELSEDPNGSDLSFACNSAANLRHQCGIGTVLCKPFKHSTLDHQGVLDCMHWLWCQRTSRQARVQVHCNGRLTVSIEFAQNFQREGTGTYSRTAVVQAEILLIGRVSPYFNGLDP